MLGERLAGGPTALESGDRGLRGGRVSLGTILPKVRLEILELHLELFDQPGMAFSAVAILLAPKFGDLKSQVTDHVLGSRDHRLNLGQFTLCNDQCSFGRSGAGLRRSKGGAQNSDLRGGLRHAGCLPRGRRICQ